jgi:hypothetical protein
MPEPVRINDITCSKVAGLLKGLRLRDEFYRRPFLTLQAPAETRLRAFFYSVAICHQTYNLHHPGLGLYGWDYLEHVFTGLMKENSPFLLPGISRSMGIEEISLFLATQFSHDGHPEQTTLDRLEERAEFIIDLDVFVDDLFDSRLTDLVETAGNRLVNHGTGFYDLLPSVIAFSDPMKKKITFLLKLLEEAGIVSITDPENFIPIMDYHMQRVLLRLGCLEVTDPGLREKLTGHIPLNSDEEVRGTCIDAFRIIAAESAFPVTKLNDVFWSLGRSCCNQEPLCQYHCCEKDPCTFFQIVALEEHLRCIFTEICRGASDESYRKLWQPIVETHYY